MKTRNIRREEIFEYSKNKKPVFIHLIDREKGTDHRAYESKVIGFKNCPDFGTKVRVKNELGYYWRPLNCVFVEEKGD
jgi:hypothetical protein